VRKEVRGGAGAGAGGDDDGGDDDDGAFADGVDLMVMMLHRCTRHQI
jgi:hypothetical protein